MVSSIFPPQKRIRIGDCQYYVMLNVIVLYNVILYNDIASSTCIYKYIMCVYGNWQAFRDTMLRRIFFPGEVLLLEDSELRDLVLLARGAVSIEIAGRTIRVERRGESLRGLTQREAMEMEVIGEDALHPAVFGDAEFLGLNERRVSTIKADAEPRWL